jgi:hypothetical protein
MTNEVTEYEPDDDDDGFGGSITGFRGNYLRWTAADGWLDRDEAEAPALLLVVKVDELLKRWKNNEVETIRKKPLPDPDELNRAIPMSEWEKGIDGKPRPPWSHNVSVTMVNPATGAIYVYEHDTAGAHIAWEHLREQVIVMRSLRGSRTMPVVKLGEAVMNTKRFGKVKRPSFEIVDWKLPPGGGETALPKPAPQLSGPLAATPPAVEKTAASPAKPAAKPGKPAIDLNAMGDVKPVSLAEELNDSVPF